MGVLEVEFYKISLLKGINIDHGLISIIIDR